MSNIDITKFGTQTGVDPSSQAAIDSSIALALVDVVEKDTIGVINGIPRYSDITGKKIKNTNVLIDDGDKITLPTSAEIKEQASESVATAGYVKLFAKSDKKLYSIDDTGLETLLGGGAGSLGSEWTFSVSIAGAPASGIIRFDNTTPASVAQIVINDLDKNGINQSAILNTLANGDQLLVKNANETNTKYFNITGATDNTTYYTLDVALEYETDVANFLDTETLTFLFFPQNNIFNQSLNTDDQVAFKSVAINSLDTTPGTLTQATTQTGTAQELSSIKTVGGGAIATSSKITTVATENHTAGNIGSKFVFQNCPNTSDVLQTNLEVSENGIKSNQLVLDNGVNTYTLNYTGGTTNQTVDIKDISTDLQSAYNLSSQPQITTSIGNQALQIKRGSALDTEKVLEVLNGAGTPTFNVDGNGDIIANEITLTNDINARYLTLANDTEIITDATDTTIKRSGLTGNIKISNEATGNINISTKNNDSFIELTSTHISSKGDILPTPSLAYDLGGPLNSFGDGYINNLNINTATAVGTINCRNIIPTANFTYNLGSLTNKFLDGYIHRELQAGINVINRDGITVNGLLSAGVSAIVDVGEDLTRFRNGYFSGELKTGTMEATGLITTTNLEPNTTGVHNLGSVTKRYNNIIVNNVSTLTITATGLITSIDIEPLTTDLYDIGSDTKKYRDGYFSGTVNSDINKLNTIQSVYASPSIVYTVNDDFSSGSSLYGGAVYNSAVFNVGSVTLTALGVPTDQWGHLRYDTATTGLLPSTYTMEVNFTFDDPIPGSGASFWVYISSDDPATNPTINENVTGYSFQCNTNGGSYSARKNGSTVASGAFSYVAGTVYNWKINKSGNTFTLLQDDVQIINYTDGGGISAYPFFGTGARTVSSFDTSYIVNDFKVYDSSGSTQQYNINLPVLGSDYLSFGYGTSENIKFSDVVTVNNVIQDTDYDIFAYQYMNDVTAVLSLGALGEVNKKILSVPNMSGILATDIFNITSPQGVTVNSDRYKFTVDKGGFYNIAVSLVHEPNQDNSELFLVVYKNNVESYLKTFSTKVKTRDTPLTMNGILELNAGDFVDLRMYVLNTTCNVNLRYISFKIARMRTNN